MTPARRTRRVYLQDILSAIARIKEYTAKGKADFLAQDIVQDGVIRQLSIIGEAAAKLPVSMRAEHPEIPWKKVIGMRNVIVHDYSEVNVGRIWDTVERDLPVLKKSIETILGETAA